MTRRIRVLPDTVANQIAAGEVVERPASAVKELVENALDAAATRVDIELEQGGKRRIRVSDDGHGMGREDALLCLDRHATSKIVAASDLVGVRTLGFRGEALPSIAAVSRLTLETSEADAEAGATGTRVVVEGGRIDAVEDCARRHGTTVDVRNLFFNAPARAKFMKAVAAETRAVYEVVTALALANPRVTLTLRSDARTLLDLPGVAGAAERVAQLWGDDQAVALVPADGRSDGAELHGLVQRPDAARPGIRRSFLFVNGRPFRATGLLKAAERGYRTTIPQGAKPWIFLYLRMAGQDVDVNVHPTKVEVRFREQARVEDLIERAVREALQTEASAATLDRAPAAPWVVREQAEPGEQLERRSPAPDAQIALFVAGASLVGGTVQGGSTGPVPLPEGRPRLWQVLDTYVLAETRDGLLIIDQHSAHERILFQRLMNAFAAGGEHGQRLLFPLTLRMSGPEMACLVDLRNLLERAGFEIEPFGGDTVIVHSVPDPHPYFDAERAIREMVNELTHGSELVRAAKNQHERIAMTFACKSAIKAGQRLSDAEMHQLFDQLFATDLPHHDVHGRPTVVRLSTQELSRRFGRS
jgi:DNA mismatch repair protein MutL